MKISAPPKTDSLFFRITLTLVIALLLYSQLPMTSTSAAESHCVKCIQFDDLDSDALTLDFSIPNSHSGFYFSNNFYNSKLAQQNPNIPQQRAPPVFLVFS